MSVWFYSQEPSKLETTHMFNWRMGTQLVSLHMKYHSGLRKKKITDAYNDVNKCQNVLKSGPVRCLSG